MSTASLAGAVFPPRPLDNQILPTHVRQGGTVLRAWGQILNFCDNSYEELRDTLNWGATEEEVDKLQEGLGQSLPLAVREWLYCCNGQEIESNGSCNDGLFFGLPFLAAESILHEWQFWRYVDNDAQTGANPRLRKRMSSCPDSWVRREYSCPGWIPLVTDHMGNYLGVDLMPDPQGGSIGQVIIFGRDFDTKVVVYGCDGHDGWAKFLQLLADELQAGKTFQLEPPSDSDGEEDTIGYQSYFTGGTSGALGGGGDRTGEPNAGFFLVGEYKNWPVLESWADRSVRRWDAAGMTAGRSHAESSSRPIAMAQSPRSPISPAPDTSLDPMDPLRATKMSGPAMPQHPSPSATPSTSPSREPRREMVEPRRQRAMPAPQPLLDLPTIEDVRAIQATEQARAEQHSSQRGGRLGGIRDMAPFSFGPAYRTMQAQRAAPTDESVELSFRPSTDRSAQSPGPRSTVVGQRGSRTHPLTESGEPMEPAAMRSTSRLIETHAPEHTPDLHRPSRDKAPAEHVVSMDEEMSTPV
ncbi:Cell wall assembly regulator [Malassezia obtusa]|uniref:Cell wall assembly regulator n=1 Tax=Malassezia obtusa TaxID=76774 RepID=A0AAF0DXN9_9BASI|nr:Cell wall assembly regulator [Malassezia obtusa]